jgi:hypothetical protein
MSAVGGGADVVCQELSGPLLAEGVEKVGAVRLFATIVPLSGACGNIDSTLPPTLNHCFKNSDPEDFFNTLSHKRSFVCVLKARNQAIEWLRKGCSSLGVWIEVRFSQT